MPTQAPTQTTSPLTPAERAALDSGQSLVVTEDVVGSSWPRAIIRRVIAATPEEAAAVFVGYERHAAFLPNVLEARVSRVVTPATAEVDYVIRVPIVADEAYTVRNELTRETDRGVSDPGGTVFRVRWSLVRATSTKAAEGEARFEPFGTATLMTYRTLVVPGGRIAGIGFIRRRAQRDVEATVEAIDREIERLASTDRAVLDGQVLRLRAMLAR